MKADVFDTTGKKSKTVDLPIHFSEPIRTDLIKRAFLSMRSHSYQPQGVDPLAGNRKIVELSKRRRKYRTIYGFGGSRTPRKVMSRIGGRFNWQGAMTPFTKGGRTAHPPLVIKKIKEKINIKERRKAIRSAIAATINKRFSKHDKPIIFESKVETINKTKAVKDLLSKIDLKDELKRAEAKKVRAGKGKMRSRKYKRKKGPLIIASKNCPLLKSGKNIPGVDTTAVNKLNAELLAPGGKPGRTVVWTEDAITKLKELFI